MSNENKPWVSNYPALQAWLDKRKAFCMWQVPTLPRPDNSYDDDWHPPAYVEGWLVGGRPCIILVHANKQGWDIYTPPTTRTIDATFLDAETRLGIVK